MCIIDVTDDGSSQIDQGTQSTILTPVTPPTSSHSGSGRCASQNLASSSSGNTLLDDIASSTSCPPCQPVGITFPVTYFSKKARSFNPDWFKVYPWLEYSVKKDAAFCYPCRLFGAGCVHSSRPEKTFSSLGFRDWKHATGQKGILVSHNNSLSHKQAVVAWEQFKLSQDHGLVAEQLGSNRAQQISKNRHYIKSIAEVLLLCSKQEISFRGHDESDSSLNKGNLLEILGVLAKHDPIIEDRLFHGPRNAKYTSNMIQNNILAVMANHVRKQICGSVQKAQFYSLMVDETKDLSKQ